MVVNKSIFLFFVCPCVAFAQSCPTGMVAVEYDAVVPALSGVCPMGYVASDIDAVCGVGDGVCWLVEQLRELCGAGISNLKTSGGSNIPLYSTRATTPSLCIKYNDTTCYVDLESGTASGAININYNGVTYHTVK